MPRVGKEVAGQGDALTRDPAGEGLSFFPLEPSREIVSREHPNAAASRTTESSGSANSARAVLFGFGHQGERGSAAAEGRCISPSVVMKKASSRLFS